MRNVLDQEGTSGRGKSFAARLAMSVAAIAAAVLLLGLGAAAFAPSAHAQVAGATYSGSFQAEDAGCGGGTIELTLADDGTIVHTLVDGAMFGGVPIDDLSIDIDPPIDIADDGSFSATFDAVPGIPVTFAGTFDGDTVSGSVDVPALSCLATFTASTSGDGMDDGDDDGMDDGDDDMMDDGDDMMDDGDGAEADDIEVTSMPSSGSGPAGSTNSQTTIWLALAAGLAAVGFASIGVAQRIKR